MRWLAGCWWLLGAGGGRQAAGAAMRHRLTRSWSILLGAAATVWCCAGRQPHSSQGMGLAYLKERFEAASAGGAWKGKPEHPNLATPDAIFAVLDENSDGWLMSGELEQLSQFVVFSTGQDGVMDYNQFMRKFRNYLGKNVAAGPGLFAALDTDGSTFLEPDEMKDIGGRLQMHLQALGRAADPALAQQLPPRARATTGPTSFIGSSKEREGEGEFHGHPPSHPKVANATFKAKRDLSFAEFEEEYGPMIRTGSHPHSHYRAFMALDRNFDNVISSHELNSLKRFLASPFVNAEL